MDIPLRISKKVCTGSWAPILVTSLCFVTFLLLSHPSYNSDDDIYFLYALSGAYGEPPSNLLHYSYSWHPVLSWPILKLFECTSHINWYTICLLAFHLAGCSHLSLLLQRQFNTKKALIIFLIFFLFIESRLLLSLNYSGTSLILCISGLSAFANYKKGAEKSQFFSRQLAIPALLIIAGGLMRPHMFALCLLLTLSTAFFRVPFSQYKNVLQVLVLPCSVLLLAVAWQQYYYGKKIPGWQEDNNFRESLFSLYNRPAQVASTPDSNILINHTFISRSFIYDTAFVSPDDISLYTQKAATSKISFGTNHQQRLYWTFMESRVYLFLWTTILLGFLFSMNSKATRRWLWQCLPAFLFFCCLYLFFKLTESIFLALFSSVFLSAAFTVRELSVKNRSKLFIFYILLFFCSAWMVKRLISMDNRNKQSIRESRSAIDGLNVFRDLLFISSDNHFPLNLSIWDTPAGYPLKNFINKELMLTNTHKKILTRRNIISLAYALPRRNDIILIGNTLPLLKEYYWTRNSLVVDIKKGDRIASMNTYQVNLVSSK